MTIFGANLGPPVGYATRSSIKTDFVASSARRTRRFCSMALRLRCCTLPPVRSTPWFRSAWQDPPPRFRCYIRETHRVHTVAVQPASPAYFRVDGSGGGQGAILNQDGSVNSRSNPAPRGSVVYSTPPARGSPHPPARTAFSPHRLIQRLTFRYRLPSKAQPAASLYAGAAPGLVAGVMQINVVVPANCVGRDLRSSGRQVGEYSSPSAVTSRCSSIAPSAPALPSNHLLSL